MSKKKEIASYLHEIPPMPKRSFFRDLKERARDSEDDNNSGLYKHMSKSPGGGARDFRKPKNMRATLGRILGYATENKLLFVLILLMTLITTGCQIVSMYFLRPLVDNYIIPGDFKGLLGQLGILACIYLVSAACGYLQSRLMVNLGQWAVNKIRDDLFSKLQNLPLKFFDGTSHGELMSRFTNDAENIQMMIEMGLIQFISGILSLGGTILLLLILSWQMFIIIAAVLAIALFVVQKTGSLSKIMFKRQQASLGGLNGFVEEMTDGLKVVKAFNFEKRAVSEFDHLNGEYRENAIIANFLGQLPMPVLSTLMNICYAVVAVVGGLFVINGVGSFKVGSLGVYLNATRQLAMPINQISNQLVNLMSSIAGAERIFEVMDTQPETDEGRVTLVTVDKDSKGMLSETQDGRRTGYWAWKIPSEGGIEYREVRGDVRFFDVHFGYVPDKLVLKDISVYAKPGQKIAFVGSTGAGKTTITNLINRFYEIESGQITFDGIDVRDIKKAGLRRSLGMVLQDIQLFTGTVMDNIRYGKLDATDEECIAAAKSANAHSFITRLPDGYQTEITGNGRNLSQGQRQLLGIARTAVAKHPVMIMDEATSSIDTRTEKQIERGLDALMEGKTVFVIAHRLSTVRNSKAIAVIENGEIIEKGNHEELLALKGRYYKLYTGQSQLD